VATMPDLTPLTGTTVPVTATDPPIPVGRRVVFCGTTPDGLPLAVAADVVRCEPTTGAATLTLAAALPPLSRQGLVMLANVARATHGESVAQVLGSGDGRTPFMTFPLRRPPLTYVRAATAQGARAALVVRVDGVQWTQVDSFLDSGPRDRVFLVRRTEDGGARIVLGDGVHGARAATGTENVTALYRAAIGADGGVPARSVSLLVRRPLGIRDVTNPLPATGWASAETLQEARTGAPLLVRTLDRAVSVADHEDFARGYAGVGPAQAALLWDGTRNRVLVSVLGNGAARSGRLDPGDGLVTGLHAALDAARDPSVPLDVRSGEQLWFGLRMEVAHDPAQIRQEVLAAVQAALLEAFGPPARQFAAPVTAGSVLVAVRSVRGVAACTMPRLFLLGAPPAAGTAAVLPADGQAASQLRALPGRWNAGVVPAQLLGLAGGAVEIGGMPQ
jgi:predicted phage baseplate assembly protein